MEERDFFIEILKLTPDDSIIETTEYIDPENAKRLGLINFDNFSPNSVGLIFSIDSNNRGKWIEYFNTADISDSITHYRIYKGNSVIANGFDHFEINIFDKKYFPNNFEQFSKNFEINFQDKLSDEIQNSLKIINFSNVGTYQESFFTDISITIDQVDMNLRIAIEKEDYNVFFKLINDLKPSERLQFKGVYSSDKNSQELGITIKTQKADIDLMIDSTRKLISNLIWIQGIENKKDIEHLIKK